MGKDPVPVYAAETLDRRKPAIVRATELEGKDGVRLFATARHDLIGEILADEAAYSLEHYDKLLETLIEDVHFFLGVDTLDRQERESLLHATFKEAQTRVSGDYRLWVAGIAREEALRILAILTDDARRGAPVNLVREFAYLAAYRCAWRIFGLAGPVRPPLLARLLMFGRNLWALVNKRKWLPLKGEFGSAMSLFWLYHIMFGYLFGPPSTRRQLRLISKWSARNYMKVIREAMESAKAAPHESWLAAMIAVQPEFAAIPRDRYRHHVAAIMFELVSAMTLLIGRAFSEMAGKLAVADLAEFGTDWASFSTQLAGLSATSGEAHLLLDEALRFAGGTRLLRTATKNGQTDHVTFNKGDEFLLLLDFASLDPNVFTDPHRFNPDKNRPYVTFAQGGAHACYGRDFARIILAELTKAVAEALEPDTADELTLFLGLPDDMRWRLKPLPPTPAAAGVAPAGRNRLLNLPFGQRTLLGRRA